MRSAVAEAMKERERARMRQMTPSERLELALRLGDEAVARYALAHAIPLDQARRELRENSERLRPRPFWSGARRPGA
jgi:hypothetical protein